MSQLRRHVLSRSTGGAFFRVHQSVARSYIISRSNSARSKRGMASCTSSRRTGSTALASYLTSTMGDDGGDDDGDDDGEDGDGTSTTSWMKNGRELGAFGLGVQLSTIGVSLIANSTGTLRHMLMSSMMNDVLDTATLTVWILCRRILTPHSFESAR